MWGHPLKVEKFANVPQLASLAKPAKESARTDEASEREGDGGAWRDETELGWVWAWVGLNLSGEMARLISPKSFFLKMI